MSRLLLMIVVLVTATAGCAPSESYWKKEAEIAFDAARIEGAGKLLPAEFLSLFSVMEQGKDSLQDGDTAAADCFFRFAWLKARLLHNSAAEEKRRRADEAMRKNEEVAFLQQQRIALKEQQNLKRQLVPNVAGEKTRQRKERLLPAFHTVRHGESLPQIAAQAEVYNDFRLWPLLYRSNRDQVSNPHRIWPGQILRIPRNSSREEISDARRYSIQRPF